MRELIKRLERLETRQHQPEPLRAIWRVISPLPGGGAAPYDPKFARAPQSGLSQIARMDDETPEAFEARALACFPSGRIVMSTRDRSDP